MSKVCDVLSVCILVAGVYCTKFVFHSESEAANTVRSEIPLDNVSYVPDSTRHSSVSSYIKFVGETLVSQCDLLPHSASSWPC
jgi:hypothetical protein